MAAADLVTAGEAFEDLIFADLPRLPRPGEELKTSRFVSTVGGGAVITAVAAHRAGARCHVISGLSDAAVGRLTSESIGVTNLRRNNEPHALTAALSTRDTRTFVTFNGINDRLEARLYRAARTFDGRHVHFALFPSRCGRWRPVVSRLRRAGVTTSWDFGWNERLLRDPEFLPLVGELDYLMLNEQEAMLYAGTERLQRALAFWKQQARVTLVKLGSRGSRWLSADLTLDVPAPQVRVVDTTGAGDAFNGGFLAARLRGAGPQRALAAGNRMGAFSTRALGGLDGLPRARGHR